MTKLFLTMTLALSTMVASAQYSAITTITSVEDEAGESTYNVTDKIGVGYQLGEKLMVGITAGGENTYELLGRYSLMNGVWGTCVYSDHWESDVDLIDRIYLGLGYSFKVWNNLYVDPNYTMPAKADENGDREGTLNLGVSYKF